MKPDNASPEKTDATLLARLESEARRLGFDAVGVTTPDALAATSYAAPAKLDRYITLGHHGDMHWMAEHIERRRDPAILWNGARSIIMLGTSYAPDEDPLEILNAPDRAGEQVSVDAAFVEHHLGDLSRSADLSRYVL